MIFHKPAILDAFAFLPTLTSAVELPRLAGTKGNKKDKDDKHHFDLAFKFDTEGDFDYTPEVLSIIEQAIIMSCNESHPSDKFHMYSFSIAEASHGPVNLQHLRGKDDTETSELDVEAGIWRWWFWHQQVGDGFV